jgi:hypothetical protein
MFDSLLAMGSTRADRELSRLRMAYTAAARGDLIFYFIDL